MLLKHLVIVAFLLSQYAYCTIVVGHSKIYADFSRVEKNVKSDRPSIGRYKICTGRTENENLEIHKCELFETKIGKVLLQSSTKNTYIFPIGAERAATDIILYPTIKANKNDKLKALDEDVYRVRIPLLFPGDETSVEIFPGFKIQVSLECKVNHFGPRCEVFCDDSRSEGSFTCHPKTGELVCGFGWIGPECSENVFIDRETASQFIKTRPKRSCSTRSCTNEELLQEFLTQGVEFTEKDWTKYYNDLNECKGSVCDKNGTYICVKSEESFLCRCKVGYKGEDCSELDLCHLELCQNGASCQTREGQYYCECPEGFEGKFCEIETSRCIDEPCGYHGKCVPEVSGFRCECEEGFTGKTCEVNIDDCVDNPCGSNGQCHDGDNSYECECDDGYYGTHCEILTDGCLSAPCQNGGVCHGFVDGYFECQCSQGFTGSTCEETYNSTCKQNNVTCSGKGVCVVIDEDTSFCRCDSGFEGDYCETLIGSCEREEPCPHNSTCMNIENDLFICVCPSGYEGRNCEIECGEECEKLPVLQCDDNLCENGGRCFYSGSNTTTCMCPGFMFEGDRCQNRILDDECERLLGVCKNGAECKNTEHGDGYKCMCTKGFAGMHCDHVIDECYSNPCQNGGSCRARDGAYVCDCRIGYFGFHCEEILDYCADDPSPCKNNGLCEVTSLENHEIKCTCKNRFYGKYCEEKVPVCLVKVELSPGHHELAEREDCGSHGECVPDGEDHFKCKCNDGYDGEFCNQKKSRIIECKDVYCKCRTMLHNYKALHQAVNEGDQCFHERYGQGVCGREKCISMNCSETDDLVCHYETSCLETTRPPSGRSHVSTQLNVCPRIDLYFKRNKLLQNTTVQSLCDKIRKIDILESLLNTTVTCALENSSSLDIQISATMNSGENNQDIQVTAGKLFQFLNDLILSLSLNDKQSDVENPSFAALRNASFESRFVLINSSTQRSITPTPAVTTREYRNQKDMALIIALPIVCVLVLLALGISFFIWKSNRDRRRNGSSPSSNNNNIPADSVKWSADKMKSDPKSFENPLVFGIDNKVFTLKDNPPESPSMARIKARIKEEEAKTDMTSSSKTGMSTFVGSENEKNCSDDVNIKG